jgi:3-phenylpropionate/trans-cinnamate dioxygenase ferredoxin reductase component
VCCSRQFIVFWLEGGRVLAGIHVNVWYVAEDIQRLVRSGETVQAGGLAESPSAPRELVF